MNFRDFLLGVEPPQRQEPAVERAPMRERGPCVCGHAHQMHGPGGRGKCALWKSSPTPGACWCDGYDGADEGRLSFPVTVLEQPKGE